MPRRRPFADPKQKYVYVWRLNGQVLYVGCGINNRGRPTCQSSWSGRCSELIEVLKVHRNDIEVEYVSCMSKEVATTKERELISSLSPKYNVAPGSGGFKGMHTIEGLSRISRANKGRKVSQQIKDAQSKRMKGNKHLEGHKHSEETKKKISESGKGRQVSNKHRETASQRISLLNKTNPPRKGKACSEEHRRNLSEAAKRRVRRAPKIS